MKDELPLSLPPRGLSREQGAAYVGVGTDVSDALVRKGELPAGLELRGRRVWDRAALDHRLDVLSGLVTSAPSPTMGKAAALEAIRDLR